MVNLTLVEVRENVFNFVSRTGPVLPVDVAKFVEKDILIASAMLSDLVSQNKVFVSKTKIGGSPVYYVKGQESKLVQLSKYLGDKQKKIYDLLYSKKVLKDTSMDPWQRVAIREIKDFAKKLDVSYGGKEEIFWKWYMLKDEEVKVLVKESLGDVSEKADKKEVDVEKSEVQKDLEGKKVVKPKRIVSGKFYEDVVGYFGESEVKILEEKVVRKGKEINFVVEIPSQIGKLKFFVKAKDKKKINDADLSVAHSEGSSKNLSVLFLTCGELTKKAKEMVENRIGGVFIFKKI